MKYEVDFILKGNENKAGSWFLHTTYRVSANNKTEAQKKGILKFKKRYQMSRFYSKKYVITIREV